MDYAQLIDDYLAGPQKLRAAVAGMTAEQLDARPIPGKWSTKQVICHVADYEPVYVDRMKRVIAEEQPERDCHPAVRRRCGRGSSVLAGYGIR